MNARSVFLVTLGTLILLALPMRLQAEDGQPPPGPVLLTGQDDIPLGPYLDLLADPTGSPPTNDARSAQPRRLCRKLLLRPCPGGISAG